MKRASQVFRRAYIIKYRKEPLLKAQNNEIANV